MLLKFIIFSIVFYFILKILSRLFVFTVGSSNTRQQGRSSQKSKANKWQDIYTRKSNTAKNNLDNIEEAEFEDITEEKNDKQTTSS